MYDIEKEFFRQRNGKNVPWIIHDNVGFLTCQELGTKIILPEGLPSTTVRNASFHLSIRWRSLLITGLFPEVDKI